MRNSIDMVKQARRQWGGGGGGGGGSRRFARSPFFCLRRFYTRGSTSLSTSDLVISRNLLCDDRGILFNDLT